MGDTATAAVACQTQRNPAALPGRPWRVIVADDDEVVRTLIVEHLKEDGYETFESANGQELVAALGQWLTEPVEQPFDLIISDIRMPCASGIEILNLVRCRKPVIPFILITGYSSTALSEAEIGKLYPSGIYYKPFPIQDLLNHVRALLPLS